MASQQGLLKVNVLAELDRLGKKYEFSGDAHVTVLCPFHEDHSPSCSISTETGQFKCFACKASGDFTSYVCRLTGHDRVVVYADLTKRYNVSAEPCVDMEVIEHWHTRLWFAPPLLKALRDRGVTDAMIRERRLGENDGRVTIPIWEAGAVVNVRKYLPGAPGKSKMRNMQGRSKPRFFMEDQLKYDRIMLCGGEMKALVAAGQLNEHGIGAISATCGEGNWAQSLTDRLIGKHVVIVYDVDEEGVKAAQTVAAALWSADGWVGVASLPLSVADHPHGDINDFVVAGGQLLPIFEACEQWAPHVKVQVTADGDVIQTDLNGAYSHEMTGKRLRLECVVSAIDSETYVVPRETSLKCDRAQDFCPECPVFVSQLHDFTVSPENPAILEMVGSSKLSLRPALMNAVGVPSRCQSVEFEVASYMQADEVRLSPKLEILSTAVTREYQRAVCVKRGLQLNETYQLTGRQYPHPRNQSAAVLVSEFETSGDALSMYREAPREQLSRFQPAEWTLASLTERLNSIYADLVRNVTRVRQRVPMHVLMDMVWHSPLFMTFNGQTVKGYVEALIVGDSAQGKSETSQRLLHHYGCGAKVECKNATVAGLLGGLQQINGRWFVTWGIIPTHDKRLVILEEFKGAPVEVISKLTEMRSSGVAELPKIEKRRTPARARLLALSNPRNDRVMSSHNFGVEAVQALIGAPEDVRRFDACMVVASGEVDAAVINTPHDSWQAVPHTYDADSCRQLIMWAWTRQADQVTFEPEAEKRVLEVATSMCDLFTSDIPIVDVASMRMKLARLSAAVACRTFSVRDDSDAVLVRVCHVEFVAQFLEAEYSKPAMGYVDYTRAVRASSVMADAETVEKRLTRLPHARDFVESVLRATKFDHQDVQDWSGMERAETTVLMSLLVRKRAVMRHGRAYVKTPGFIDMLRRLSADGKLPDLPDHLKGGDY